MRIIAGRYRGRRIVSPKDLSTRPTPDRVREALFSMLGGRVVDARVLDLFAGTGALGLEALSRGANEVVFVETNATVLMQNIALLKASGTSILRLPADKALRQITQPFDLVFIDPPYAANLWHDSMQQLLQYRLLCARALVVCEHPTRGAVPQAPVGLHHKETRAFGDVSLSFYSMESPQ